MANLPNELNQSSIKFLFTITLLALIGCAGNKPVAVEKQVDKCEKIANSYESTKETLLMPTSLYNIDTNSECFCYEIITCNNTEYCYSFLCPNGKIEKIF